MNKILLLLTIFIPVNYAEDSIGGKGDSNELAATKELNKMLSDELKLNTEYLNEIKILSDIKGAIINHLMSKNESEKVKAVELYKNIKLNIKNVDVLKEVEKYRLIAKEIGLDK